MSKEIPNPAKILQAGQGDKIPVRCLACKTQDNQQILKMPRFPLLVLLFGLANSSLAQQPAMVDAPKVATADDSQGKVNASGASQPQLNPELTLDILAGELAVRRHQMDTAFKYLNAAARATNNPDLAERSARLALFINDTKALESAISFWLERSPDNLDARRFALSLALDNGKLDEAAKSLEQLVTLADREKADGFLLAAQILSKYKDSDKAIELLDTLVKAHDKDARAWLALGLLNLEVRKFAPATEALSQALTLKPGWDKAVLLKARVLLALERNDEALELLRTGLLANPDNIDIRHEYARLLVQMDRFQAAYDEYATLLKDRPDVISLQYALGILAMELKKYDLAEQHFEAIKDSSERRNEASFHLGRIAEERKQLNLALDWYRRVLGGEFQLQAKVRAADLLAKRGNLRLATEEIEAARKQWPEQSVALFIAEAGLLMEHKAHYEQVFNLFAEALRAHPHNADLLYARALYAANQGRITVMETDLKQVLKQQPDNADALNALGYCLADQTDRYQEALGYIQKALALKPDSPAILDSMGWVQFRLGKLDDALDYIRKAAAKINDGEILSHLGEILWIKGQTQEAMDAWRKAQTEFPDNDVLKATLNRLGISLD